MNRRERIIRKKERKESKRMGKRCDRIIEAWKQRIKNNMKKGKNN